MIEVRELCHRHRARGQGKSTPVVAAQRSRADALHQRMSHVIGTQAIGAEVAPNPVDEWAVAIRLPAPLQIERRTIPVKHEAHDDAACIGVVGQHVTHPRGIRIRAVGEGDDDVVRL